MASYLLLPRLEDIPIVKEEWLHLVDTSWCDEDEIEDGEQSKLQGEGAVSDFPEGETAEQTSKDVENNLVPHIILQRVSSSVSRAYHKA